MSRSFQLAADRVTKRYGAWTVLDRVSFTMRPRERVGVIGENGAGKSTLLRLLAGVEDCDSGELTISALGRVGYLPQHVDLAEERTVGDAIDLALSALRRTETELREAERTMGENGVAARYAELLERFEAEGGWDADREVTIACEHLGLSGLERDRQLATLSGGERKRLMLAAVLASRPELLVLDEPSNALDDEAVGWLEARLRDWRGTVVVATHDRTFLDEVTTTVLEVADSRVRRYGNGYVGYLATKATERRKAQDAFERWQAEVERQRLIAEDSGDRLAAIPRKVTQSPLAHARSSTRGASSRVRIARQRLERLRTEPVHPPPQPLRFRADLTTTEAEGVALRLTAVRVARRLDVPELIVAQGERALVTGANGAGKSTLLQVLSGDLEPDTGQVERVGAVGHLRQRGTRIDGRTSVLRAFAAGRAGTLEEHAETLWRMGLFADEDFGKPVDDLSWGQRRRLELARLVSEPADILLLDEPTDHLAPLLIEDLQTALDEYDGAVVLVSHDRRLRSSFRGRRLHLVDGLIADSA